MLCCMLWRREHSKRAAQPAKPPALLQSVQLTGPWFFLVQMAAAKVDEKSSALGGLEAMSPLDRLHEFCRRGNKV